jgi:flavodoxin
MKIWKIAAIAVAILIVVVLAGFAGMACIMFDVMSNTATGSETLTPAGNSVGKALVAYDPGVSGAAKTAAGKIAADLQENGYTVVLAGVKSQAAADVSGYDVIVVGGPIYAGNASSSVQAYLKALTPKDGARIGVFATGSTEIDDEAMLREQVCSLPADSSLEVDEVMKIAQGEDTDKKCADFVAALLQ